MPLTCKALTIMKPRTCVLIHMIFSYKTTTSAYPPCVKLEQVLLWLALFMLCNMALTDTFVHEILKCNHWNLKAPEQHFPLVLFIKLRKVVLAFESVDEILECLFKWKLLRNTFLWYCLILLGHLNESFQQLYLVWRNQFECFRSPHRTFSFNKRFFFFFYAKRPRSGQTQAYLACLPSQHIRLFF